jgi:hypothetical protein
MSDVHTDEDLWLVKLADGRVRSMTVDDMDAALERGELDATTEVQAPDADSWTTLGVVAGLDEAGDSAGEPSEAEADATTPLVAAAAKAAFDTMDSVVSRSAAAEGAKLSAAPRPAYDEDEDSPRSNNAPSLMPTVASVAPPSSLAAASLSTPPSSLALDLDDDATEAALRAGKKRMAFTFAAVAVGVVVCGGLVSWLSGNSSSPLPGAAAAAIQAPPPVVEAPLPADPAFEKPALTEEQKKRLAEADKARDAKKAKAAPAGGGSAPSNGKKGSAESPFHQGGDRYDPLNGSL